MLYSYMPAAFTLASFPNISNFVDFSHNEKSYRPGDEFNINELDADSYEKMRDQYIVIDELNVLK